MGAGVELVTLKDGGASVSLDLWKNKMNKAS
jgi:hypothetical protein